MNGCSDDDDEEEESEGGGGGGGGDESTREFCSCDIEGVDFPSEPSACKGFTSAEEGLSFKGSDTPFCFSSLLYMLTCSCILLFEVAAFGRLLTGSDTMASVTEVGRAEFWELWAPDLAADDFLGMTMPDQLFSSKR